MTNIQAKTLNVCPVNGQVAPPDGPKAASIPILDWTTEDEYSLDYGHLQSQGYLSLVQAIFVDNSVCGSSVEISTDGTGQTLIVRPNAQAYLPILCQNPVKLIFRRTGGTSNDTTRIQLMNYPVAPCVWDV